jgi:UDP-N-acetylglucosamine diphosphorylase/glucosamine-1-phosphate N-acetyltransferase
MDCLIKNIVIAESARADDLYPFSILHCQWEVRCGITMLFEKYKNIAPETAISYLGRQKHLASFFKRFNIKNNEHVGRSSLLIDASVIPSQALLQRINEVIRDTSNKPIAFYCQERLFALYNVDNRLLRAGQPFDFSNTLIDALRSNVDDVRFIDYLWDALDYNAAQIEEDKKYIDFRTSKELSSTDGVYFLNGNSIFIGENCSIMPNVVIDASQGSVVIGNGVKIMSGATIIGPCAIGDNSIIKIGSKIYEKTTIGPYCKVGGEVENSIIQSFSNKQHDGFLGHSYLGEWVNLGAGTNNSDLKNTYGNIKISFPNRDIETGRMFLGLLCGDHTKTAINTVFNTGTVAGICGVLVANGFLPKRIQSFAWGGAKGLSVYHLSKAIEVAKTVMQRRNRILTAEEEELINNEYVKRQ